MDTDSFLYQMALTMIPNIGAITAKKLISYVGSPEGVFREKSSNLRRIPGIGIFIAEKISKTDYLKEAEREINRMEQRNISCCYFLDHDYPWRLKECEDGPILLFYKGSMEFNRTKILSIVGTRNATPYGKDICRLIITELASKYQDLIIVSGLAYGIDITAHRIALETGLDTFAVLAHGLHTIYPPVHRDITSRIITQGGIISDFHYNVKPERNNFLRRNRIIAGLADATVIIESGKKGGALITADMAASYHREVFAIPGRITDNYSEGCNQLIKRNVASLIDSAKDIEELLNWEPVNSIGSPRLFLDSPVSDDERKILELISEEPGLGQEILSVRSCIPIHKVAGLLLQMELKNWITVMPGNTYKAAVRIC